MIKPAGADSVDRFSGLAGVYDRYRPDYPTAAVNAVLKRCHLGPGMLLVDVGCGTGISTRQMAATGLRVIGIEPNAEMRRFAEAARVPPVSTKPEYRSGQADATGLADSCADCVLAAQAFHWFAPESTFREFHRILRPHGWLVLMWNDQDRRDAFTEEYCRTLIRNSPSPDVAADVHASHGEVLFSTPLFAHAERTEFPHVQELTLDELPGRAFSASYAPKDAETRARLANELTELHRRFRRAGRIALRYRTTVYSARRS